MSHHFADIAFTPRVKRLQELHGSRAQYARMEAHTGPNDALGPAEADFLEAADGFYLSTVSETGWPYVQHRGGPAGFVRVLSSTELAFADFRGNLQHVTEGNAQHDDRAAMIVMDYANRRRLKLLGHLRFVEVSAADPDLVRHVGLPGYRARIERVARFEVAAFDWNCPQHITRRFTEAEVEASTRALRERIGELEARLARALAPL
jgi:predicted pyridoxine 5'-phosphate oxidase superfamily flavin-nucleotide-binding protein